MENRYIVWVASSLVIGLIASVLARRKGKDPFVWFCIGAAANVLVLLVWRFAHQRKRIRRVQ